MSTYAEYTTLSKDYDHGRLAACSDLYVGALFTKFTKPLSDLHVLDAGCGTGNYARALLDAGIGKVTLFDANEGMLSVAEGKLKRFLADGRAELKQHLLPTIPFADDTFDAVMINNVLHHLSNEDGFRLCREFIQEAFRALKPGGMFVIQTALTHQIEKSYWFFHLAPKALERYAKYYLEADEITSMIDDAGFRNVDFISSLSALAYDKNVYYHGTLDQIKHLDSFWSLVSSEEMEDVEKRHMDMVQDGSLDKFIREHDKRRRMTGQQTFSFALK